MLKVLYFARLREIFGIASEEISGVPLETVADLKEWLAHRGEVWSCELASDKVVRAAINQEMATDVDKIHDGDEIALFPPVTGG
ncbi:MAG: molybdopterin converting factor subunit 1 [Proteobacteria bacterium]|nr:molybdopterin converting factor subunit 1 [Pseudomonadota bacterium]MDE3207531.1 molybdopterin converting factor subunit 1 [Pseudomonadota bacterium]